MRYYEPIWLRLKKNKVVQVTAPRPLHPRIIKAVVKEKWLDLGFKLELEPSYAILSHICTNSVVTFKLKVMKQFNNITENML
jgi:hypothetical protein